MLTLRGSCLCPTVIGVQCWSGGLVAARRRHLHWAPVAERPARRRPSPHSTTPVAQHSTACHRHRRA
eukprot:8344655-Pyramimonas_sp.AAC.1